MLLGHTSKMAVIITDTPRRLNDFYQTPYGLCRQALGILPDNFKPGVVLDPGCGNGRWGIECKKLYPNSTIMGFDIDENIEKAYAYSMYTFYDYTKYLEYLNESMSTVFSKDINLVIGNPPYLYSEEFIRNSLSYLREGGYLLFLLRLDFLCSEKRRETLWKDFPPKEVWICSRRPGFNTPTDRNTDSNSYAIYLWEKGYYGEPTIKWLDWNYNKDLDYE